MLGPDRRVGSRRTVPAEAVAAPSVTAARYPPQLLTSTPSALIPAMMRSGTTRAGGHS